MAINDNPEANANVPPAGAPPAPEGSGIRLGSQAVIGVKVAAAVFGVLILVFYLLLLANTDSPYYLIGIVFGVIGLAIGIAGIFIGNIKISKRKNIPTLNIILIIISFIFLFGMPVLGSWGASREDLWDVFKMFMVLIFGVFFLCYIELCHASLRFSEIDEYAVSHNIRDFSVNAVIGNYFMWFGILIAIITLLSALVLMLQILLAPIIEGAAPALGNSLEYNSIISILISVAIIFIPIGIVLAFVFGFFFKSQRSIVVKSREDVVARKPEAVKVK
ncbi:hypothetical protein [[Eubacterium] cellulosolvens]